MFIFLDCMANATPYLGCDSHVFHNLWVTWGYPKPYLLGGIRAGGGHTGTGRVRYALYACRPLPAREPRAAP